MTHICSLRSCPQVIEDTLKAVASCKNCICGQTEQIHVSIEDHGSCCYAQRVLFGLLDILLIGFKGYG
jgi:hypothetical protein